MTENHLERLLEAFRREFGSGGPLFRVRAPGRVNLIGEHTDYNGLPVMPMALQRQIVMVVRPRPDSTVQVLSADAQYGRREFVLERPLPPFAQGDWGNYLKASAQALLELHGPLSGFDALVSGDIPPSAGLSSSSAMVVAGGLALLASNGLPVEPQPLMPLFADAERYVGTKGGGMDQAICLGGKRGMAVQIDFDPLRLAPIPIPAGWRFLIAHSLVAADKSGGAREKYNARPAECREALRRLAAHAPFEQAAAGYPSLLRSAPVDALVRAGCELLDEPLRRRFRHVVTEGVRVEQAREAMQAGDARTFGKLMNESHASLRDDFEVSCPALDELVRVGVENGALGARLTGAGFGGCAVMLTTEERAEGLVQALEVQFYGARPERAGFGEYLLPAEGSEGASAKQIG